MATSCGDPGHESVRFAIAQDKGKNSAGLTQTDPSQGSNAKGALSAWYREIPDEVLETIGVSFCRLRDEITDLGADGLPDFVGTV